MHPEAKDFTHFVRSILPEYFENKIVLDVGSGDINGNNRELFQQCIYNGNDVIPARNVTVVSRTKDLHFCCNYFDTIISTECFEHDPDYQESFRKIYNMLRPNGLFVFTCASLNRPEHGTRRTSPNESYGTIGGNTEMQDYYKNLNVEDVYAILPFQTSFIKWDCYYNTKSNDIYFYGIKKGYNNKLEYPEYTEYSGEGVVHVVLRND